MAGSTRITKESTLRSLRTFLQGLGAAAAFVVLVAIPPIGDAINALLGAIGVRFQVSPALVGAISALAAAVTALVTKIQNVVEGRDRIDFTDTASLAAVMQDLAALIEQIKGAAASLPAAVVNVNTGGDQPEVTVLPEAAGKPEPTV